MNVALLAYTKLNDEFYFSLKHEIAVMYLNDKPTDGQAIALTAIRNCYSPLKPTEILNVEGEKYFGSEATDGEGGSEADRLFRHVFKSKHTSTVEHLNFTFAIEGVSRALLAQLTRHRHFSFSVESQRYVRFGSDDKSGGFDYVIPRSITEHEEGTKFFEDIMQWTQCWYDELRKMGIPAEDARAVLPNAATCNIVMTGNLRSLLNFYSKRKPGRGAQGEIAELAEKIREEIVKVEPWTNAFFETV